MYSQPWSPTPSTTAVAPELRTQKRSPTRPGERLAAGGAVEEHVAGDDVVLGHEVRIGVGRPDHDPPPERPLPT
jgi:hypothetical protein